MAGFKGSCGIFRALSLFISLSSLLCASISLGWSLSLWKNNFLWKHYACVIFQVWFQRRRKTLSVPAFIYLILGNILTGLVEVTRTSQSQSSWYSLSSPSHQFTPVFEGGGKGGFLLRMYSGHVGFVKCASWKEKLVLLLTKAERLHTLGHEKRK